MPRVPAVQGQSVMPNAAPAPFQRVSATAEDFGAGMGRALERGGQQIANIGERLAARADQIQKEDDALAVEKAYAAFSDRERVFMYDPERGIYARRGGNAMGAYDETSKWWDEAGRETVSGLANPNQQRLMQQMLLRRRDSAMDGVARHVARERQTYMAEATDARMKGITADAAAAYNDEGKVNGLIEEADGMLREWGRRQGQSPQQIDLNTRAARSAIRQSVIERMAVDNPLAAQRYYEANKGDMDGLTQVQVERSLRAGVERQRGNMAVEKVLPKGAPLEGGDIRERVWRAEGGEAQNPAPGQTARGGGITDGTWTQYAGRLGLTQEQRGTRAAFDAVWGAYQADARAAIGRDLTPGEQYAAWFLGIGGAKAFFAAPRDADARTVYGQAAGEGIADQAFRVNGNLMRPGMTVGQVLDAVQGKVQGGTAADREVRMQGTLSKAREGLAAMRERGELNDRELEIAEAGLSREFNQRQAAEAETRRVALNGIRNRIAETKSLDGLTPQQLAFLADEPLEMQKWMDWVARAGRVQTDAATYARLKLMDPDEFLQQDLMDPNFRTKLSESDWKGFVDDQAKMKRAPESAETAAAKAGQRTRVQVVTDALREVGIDATPKEGTSGATRVAAFNRAFDGALAEWRAANPNKRPTDADYQQIADRLLIRGEIMSGAWWQPDPNKFAFELGDMSPDERRRFGVSGFMSDAKDRARVSRVTGVPVDQLDAYGKALRDAGVPVTPENLAALYRRTSPR